VNDPEAQTVVISREPMSLEELSAIARGAGVLLSDEAIERIRAARRVVEAALDGDELVYGLNTGLGHARNRRLPHSELRSLQPIIVAMHDGSMGNPLPKEVVRAAMAARLNGRSDAQRRCTPRDTGVRVGGCGGSGSHGCDRHGCDRRRPR
jgi:histidine ammonia-lyase